jgi:hypothetical protein
MPEQLNLSLYAEQVKVQCAWHMTRVFRAGHHRKVVLGTDAALTIDKWSDWDMDGGDDDCADNVAVGWTAEPKHAVALRSRLQLRVQPALLPAVQSAVSASQIQQVHTQSNMRLAGACIPGPSANKSSLVNHNVEDEPDTQRSVKTGSSFDLAMARTVGDGGQSSCNSEMSDDSDHCVHDEDVKGFTQQGAPTSRRSAASYAENISSGQSSGRSMSTAACSVHAQAEAGLDGWPGEDGTATTRQFTTA